MNWQDAYDNTQRQLQEQRDLHTLRANAEAKLRAEVERLREVNEHYRWEQKNLQARIDEADKELVRLSLHAAKLEAEVERLREEVETLRKERDWALMRGIND